MVKNILSVVAGFLVWTAVFLLGSQVVRSIFANVHNDDGYTSNVSALLIYLALSALASMAAGFACAKIADDSPMRYATITGVLLLLTGLYVQISAWDLLPVWYNLAFLVLLLPVTLIGARSAIGASS